MSHRFTPDGLCYEIHGPDDAPAVIFLNGTGQSTLYWQNAARRLRRRHRVVLYDARGQGNSPLKDATLDIEHHRDDLAGLLKTLSIARADLVGLSHGAYLAAAFAARHPGRIGRLVLCGAGAAPCPQGLRILQNWLYVLETEGITAMARRMLPDVFGPRFLSANADILGGMARAIARRNDPTSLAAHLRAVLAYRPLAQIVAPGPDCLVLGGAKDPLVPPEEARRLADLYRGRHVGLPEVGHSVPVEAGEVFLTLVESFLEENRVNLNSQI
jgi:3-oxoadipate enol-lactonase